MGRDALGRFKEHPAAGANRARARRQADRAAGLGGLQRRWRVGEVTSGTFSPTLQISLAMAYVEPASPTVGTPLTVDVRGHREPAHVVKLAILQAAPTKQARPACICSQAHRQQTSALLQSHRTGLTSHEDSDSWTANRFDICPLTSGFTVQGDVATIGITQFAVEQLTDLIMIELPAVGTKVTAGKTFGEIESVKAVSDLYAPVSGEVIEVNSGRHVQRAAPGRGPL